MSHRNRNSRRQLRYEGLEERRMLTDFFVTNISDGQIPGSLRTAISDANNNAGLDRIFFSLSASDMAAGITIVNSPLVIADPVQISGDNINNPTLDPVTIHAGVTATNAFEINAFTGGGIANGFVFQDVIIDGAFDDGIQINRLPSNGQLLIDRVGVFNTTEDGIDISPAVNNVSITIQQSTFALNDAYGIHAHNAGNSSTDLTINTNEIVGNGIAGIRYDNFDAPIDIINNNIGVTDIGGTFVSSNRIGIWIGSSASTEFSQIASNIISGNTNGNLGAGIRLQGSQFPELTIQQNGIGTDLSMDILPGVGNDDGIEVLAGSTLDQIFDNIIGGNNIDGIFVSQSDAGQVLDNSIVANGSDGIEFSESDSWNVDFNALGSGIEPLLGNTGSGVRIGTNSFDIDVINNVIGFNGDDGIKVLSTATDRHDFSANSYTNNSGLPIDLVDPSDNGFTPNDVDDGDTGPNNLLNYPVLVEGAVQLTGSTWSLPFQIDVDQPGSYQIQLYRFVDTGIGSGDYQLIGFSDFDILQVDNGNDDLTNVFVSDTLLGQGDQVAAFLRGLPGAGGITEPNTSNTSEFSPVSSGIVQDMTMPTITEIRLDGTSWSGLDAYEFSSIVAAGEQHRPIFTQDVNKLEIVFSEDVFNTLGNEIDGSELKLKRTTRTIAGVTNNKTLMLDNGDFTFSYNAGTRTGTWTFTSSLLDGKYAIHLDDSINDGFNLLDADWTNDTEGTPDIYADDPTKNFNYNDPIGIGDGTAGTMGSEFRFHFALLAGDYDGDGQVEVTEIGTGDGDGDGDAVGDAGDNAVRDNNLSKMLPLRALGDADFDDNEIVNGMDLAIWESNYGLRLATQADGDADGNQVVDGNDLQIYHDQYGMSGSGLAADFNQDGFVDGLDFFVWQTGQGLGFGVSGDVNGDAWVDGLDFLLWQSKYGLKSAWYEYWNNAVATLDLGQSLPALVGSAAPQVLDVVISGSGSTHAPFSFDTVDGSGSQLATVPVGLADTISITFNENVNVAADSIRVVGLTRGNLPTLADFSYDETTFTATWRFESWSVWGDNYLISVTDGITDVDGNWLDGEWVNPQSMTTVNSLVSEFPSGDGNVGGTFDFVMTLLPGDADQDGDVDNTDIGIMYSNYVAGLTTGALFVDGDFNGDGAVTLEDYTHTSMINDYQAGTDLADLWVLADLNGDFDVDDNDLQTISDNFGMTGATYADGDLNDDGIVDQLDLDLAFAQFGIDLDVVA